jgi:hypothetical protein
MVECRLQQTQNGSQLSQLISSAVGVLARRREVLDSFLSSLLLRSLHLCFTSKVLAVATMMGIVIMVKETKEVLYSCVTNFPNNGQEMVQTLLVYWF